MNDKFGHGWVTPRPDGAKARCGGPALCRVCQAEAAALAAAPSTSPAAAAVAGEPDNWEGAEGWEPLAWALCAEENGEEACTELIWEGGPIKEPWGDRWMKYEGEAKRMIELVRKHCAPHPSTSAAEQAGRWVPVKPTPEMVGVMHDCEDGRYSVHEAWRAILAAAPSASPAEAPSGYVVRPQDLVTPDWCAGYDACRAAMTNPQPVAPAGQAETPKCRFSTGAVNPWSGEKTAGELAGQAAAGVQGEAFVNPEDWLLTGEAATRIANGYRVTTGVVQAIAKTVHELRPAPAGERGVAEEQTAAARDVLAERQRQISAEGWSPEHDDEHSDGSLACAASCYACAAAGLSDAERDWPWDGGFKTAHPRRMLIKAGALILAEIERLDRSALSTAGKEQA